MPRPPIDWAVTDTHFFHDMLWKRGFRPQDFNERLIRNLRHLLAPQDRLFHLGDVIFYKKDRLKGILDSVPGRKYLVRGNHDRETDSWYTRNGFDGCSDALLVRDVYLTHKPAEVLPSGARINLHGHFHDFGDRVGEHPYWTPERHRLLAVERTGYAPVQLIAFAAAGHEARGHAPDDQS